MIFARSIRSIRTLTVAALMAALLLLGGTATLALTGRGWDAIVLGLLGAVAAAVAARFVIRLRRWPAGRLALFRDRLVLVTGRLELQAAWAEIQTASLADHSEQGWASWPEIRLTERLSVRLRSGRAFSFRPKRFGLEPVACRDLFLTLRDDSRARERLPVFDSALDLAVRRARQASPVQIGELMRPQL
jgi:hypothetical protein